MSNMIHNFKRYFEFVTPDEQLREINRLIKEFNKSYLPCSNINKKFSMKNQRNTLKKKAIN